MDLLKRFIRLLSLYTVGKFGESLAFNSKGPTKCVPINNQQFEARPRLVDTFSNKTLFYPFIVSVDKCGGDCSTIDDPIYARVCVANKVKNTTIKVYSLITGVN